MLVLFIFIIFLIWCFRQLTGKMSDSLACLVGKTAIITGGNSGIGYATALLLASRGCRIIIADKANADKSKENLMKITGNSNIFTKYLDLSSLSSVRSFCEDIQKHEKKIDILINNAGIGSAPEHCTKDGLNLTMQINFFGSFLLTHLLIDSLKAAESARVTFTGSALAYINNVSKANLNETSQKKDIYSLIQLYGNSKFCNILAAQEFGKRLKNHKIAVNSTDPGLVRTGLFQQSWLPKYLFWVYAVENSFRLIFSHIPMVGAQTNFHLASSLDMKGKTGGHYFICRPWFKPKILKNEKYCSEIWEESEKLVGLKDEEKLSAPIS
ncbi:hypothetical protein WA026_014389 [Henosepilachna vigintioctopunctata]|uniref:Uncharacterized protein n=1 Tax=Henosepilachna vigintioctopunctata TaxID=420089 RepID=A0AAW1UDG8_9CUCU